LLLIRHSINIRYFNILLSLVTPSPRLSPKTRLPDGMQGRPARWAFSFQIGTILSFAAGGSMQRTLGRSGIKVGPLAFGGNVFGWTADEPTSFRLLDAFVGSGLNLIDTADVYSAWVPGHHGGESETVIGKWLKQTGKRDKIVIATKVGMSMGEGRQGLSRKYILQAVEDSLRRLQTDYIDLYQSHEDDPATALEETLGAFADLVKSGKVRAIGASNYGGARLQQSLDVSSRLGYPRYETMQPEYNLYARQPFESEMLPICETESIGVLPYFSLASGFLTGKYRTEADLSKSPRGSRVKNFLNDRGYRILEALDQVAREKKATPAQVALAWLIAQPTVVAPLASATSVTQWNELQGAVHLGLGESDIAALNDASR
jgi:aryl-alcohol dehydrogenase-like predicted oxidoreductase